MPEPASFTFHFLRPYWLLALIPLAAILVLALRRRRPEARWGNVIAPHLLKHLIVVPAWDRRIPAAYLVAAGLGLGIVALAGPSWRRELPPFVENKAPLMIVLAVSPSMSERDVAPSRLERGKQKIRDLLAARAGARTGLIAFAGSAHLVMPLTDDAAVIEPFLAVLTPELMPVQGKNTTAAVELAARTLAAEQVPGTILVVADDWGGVDASALRHAAGRNDVLSLEVAPSARASAMVVPVAADASDIATLERRIENRYQAAQSETFGAQWRDEGFWLLAPLLLLGLLWFRRGTAVQWVIIALLWHGSPASAQQSAQQGTWFRNLWLTPDQQGRIAFERGDYAAAKELFTDPMWRGIAAYRAYDFLAAAEQFRKLDSREGRFALGNAEAQNHAYERALKAYDEVLAAEPGNQAAKTNRAIVQAAFDAQEKRRRKQEQGDASPPDEKADAMKVDPNQKGGKRIQVKPDDLTTPGAAEAWMREVQTSPADFLKLKFAIQAAGASAPPGRKP
jgi:Ca-activated chloride channel family protein